MSELSIVIEGELIGRVRADKGGRLSLEYEARWRKSSESHSLSVSMPLSHATYSQKLVLPYLWNLLPENPNVLQRWAQQYHVSAANPFKLLAFVGADVPGVPIGASWPVRARWMRTVFSECSPIWGGHYLTTFPRRAHGPSRTDCRSGSCRQLLGS